MTEQKMTPEKSRGIRASLGALYRALRYNVANQADDIVLQDQPPRGYRVLQPKDKSSLTVRVNDQTYSDVNQVELGYPCGKLRIKKGSGKQVTFKASNIEDVDIQ